MIVLSWFGLFLLYLLSFMLVVGGLLNLGGCGDRIGAKYKVSNYLQILVGILTALLCYVFIP